MSFRSQLPFVWESAFGVLRKDELIAYLDIELPNFARDQLSFEACGLFNLGRDPRGSRFVASLNAIADDHLHEEILGSNAVLRKGRHRRSRLQWRPGLPHERTAGLFPASASHRHGYSAESAPSTTDVAVDTDVRDRNGDRRVWEGGRRGDHVGLPEG